jgi:hypothetical protein
MKDQREILKILSGMVEKEVKEFVAVTSPEELLVAGQPVMSLPAFVGLVTAGVGFVGFLVYRTIPESKRRFVGRVIAALIVTPILFLVVYLHVRIWDWICFSDKPLRRAAFVAVMLVIFYSTIGLACLMAYRKRR